jgi:two-component system NtrC family sensor kinase
MLPFPARGQRQSVTSSDAAPGPMRRWLQGDGLTVAMLASVGLIALVTGLATGPGMSLPVAGTGAATIAISRVGVRERRRLGFLGRQLAWTAGATVTVGLLTTWALIVMQAHTSTDALVVAALLTAVALGVVYGTYVVGDAVAGDLDDVRRALLAVGDGRRDIRLDETGGDEAARLAVAGNRMIVELVRHESEREEAVRARESFVRATVGDLRTREAERDTAEVQRRQLVVAAAHDVRTPLTSLTLLAAALRDELVGREELSEHAEQMLRQLGVISRLTKQVFELARLEAGDVQWTLVQMHIGDLIREAVEHLRPDAAERKVDLAIDVSENLPRAAIAPDRILRVIVNLVQNALQHTPPNGQVSIHVREEQAAVVVDVCDTGAGIAVEDRERAFEPFFRGAQQTARPGAGLGLAICRAIVEAHGGHITLVDGVVGTSVRFMLPVVPPTAARPAG